MSFLRVVRPQAHEDGEITFADFGASGPRVEDNEEESFDNFDEDVAWDGRFKQRTSSLTGRPMLRRPTNARGPVGVTF